MKEPQIISCKIAAKLMSQSFERQLSAQEQLKLKAHLAVCNTCRACYRQLKALRNILPRYIKAVLTIDPPIELSLSPQAKMRIKQALRTQLI